jgi:hypothetical protein
MHSMRHLQIAVSGYWPDESRNRNRPTFKHGLRFTAPPAASICKRSVQHLRRGRPSRTTLTNLRTVSEQSPHDRPLSSLRRCHRLACYQREGAAKPAQDGRSSGLTISSQLGLFSVGDVPTHNQGNKQPNSLESSEYRLKVKNKYSIPVSALSLTKPVLKRSSH